MVLGIGTGNPIGIAGGLFHMLNNSIYKQALFLTAGNVEQKTGTSELDKLGGLAKAMPFTYISALIASLSISGIPPFNGFFSKWMVYQGIINQLQAAPSFALRSISVFCLFVAMFGSGLTLASFMKLLHAVFLGQQSEAQKSKIKNDVSWAMWLPCIVLAVICIVFGIFANQVPLKYFILPAAGSASFIRTWYAGPATLFIIIGLIIGLIVFKFKALRPAVRQSEAFLGGEKLELGETRVTGTEFYNTVQDFGIIKSCYAKAEKGYFDIYDQGKNLVFGIGKFFQYLHNGVLPTYLVWTLLGMIGLFLTLLK
jgi:NADH:ubiquinone oxidoreductase subunit 5 (subunit L)/multisubunit Na+/H+ antiporter MnhA subunit